MTQNIHPLDPSQNYLEKLKQPLDAMFAPKSVAIIGAKEDKGSVGRTIVANLLASRELSLYPVNPKRKEVLGLPCYQNISSLPARVDLAVIVTPAATIPPIVAECVDFGVKAAVIISAGFKELGEPGSRLEEAIIKEARRGTMPIIGPNCLGVMNPLSGLNATFARGMAKKGQIAFISQSGALCTAVLDWSFKENIGFSAFVSLGSMIDVGWGDLIGYFGNDPNTSSILLYMETVGDPKSFLSAAREIALQKPIVVIKPGRTTAAAKAAASHTGSLVGNDAVFDAALERVGVLRVQTISELFDMAEVLAKQPLPKGPRLGIITNAGGPAVIATDTAIQNGALISPLSDQTKNSLNAFLPLAWSHANPVDILGDASPNTYEKTLKIMLEAPEFDGILTILTPQDMTDPLASAKALLKHTSKKPLLASWMGAKSVEEGVELLNQGGISTFGFPDEAAQAFAKMWRHHENLRLLYEIGAPGARVLISSFEKQQERMEKAKAFYRKRRQILTEEESKALLALYDIPVVETVLGKTKDEAVKIAEKMGYPVVLKLHSKTITHKSDVGGVQLNLKSEREVEEAFDRIKRNVPEKDFGGVTIQRMITLKGYELILGSSIDPQFGPVILFGGGGEMVEIYQDSSLGLPPLGPINARRLIEKTKISKALGGFRGRGAVDHEKLIQIIINFSQMILENPWIEECDINPLLAGSEGIVALDARVIASETAEQQSALRPYPYQYCRQDRLKDGTFALIRPIKADDVKLLEEFHERLSEHTVHQRYLKFFSLSERVAGERLTRICLTDYTREFVLVAEVLESAKITGVIRLSKIPSTPDGQLFMIIDDPIQGKGLGAKLMDQMICVAQKEGIRNIRAKILSENVGMIALCKKFDFRLSQEGEFTIAERPFSL